MKVLQKKRSWVKSLIHGMLICDLHDEAKSFEMLQDVTGVWFTIRGFTIAGKLFEDHKKATKSNVHGKKGLRKELHWFSDIASYQLVMAYTCSIVKFVYVYLMLLLHACFGNGWQSGDRSGVSFRFLILMLHPIAKDLWIIRAWAFSRNCDTDGLSLRWPLGFCWMNRLKQRLKISVLGKLAF